MVSIASSNGSSESPTRACRPRAASLLTRLTGCWVGGSSSTTSVAVASIGSGCCGAGLLPATKVFSEQGLPVPATAGDSEQGLLPATGWGAWKRTGHPTIHVKPGTHLVLLHSSVGSVHTALSIDRSAAAVTHIVTE